MAKTCGVCEKSTQAGGAANANGFTIHCACSVTGKVHPSDHQCDVPEKPRLCEVLGVDVGEQFYIRFHEHEAPVGPFEIVDHETLVTKGLAIPLDVIEALTEAVNYSEHAIVRIPHLTPEEVQRCRDFGAKWVSQDVTGGLVCLWKKKPNLQPSGAWVGSTSCAQTWAQFFPSVQPGQLVPVEDEP